MAGAAGRAVEFLARGIEVAAANATRNARAVKAGVSGAIRPAIGRLGDAATDVSAWGDDFGFAPSVSAGTAAGKVDDIIGAVGAAISHAAAITAIKWLDILGGANAEDVFAAGRGADRLSSGTGVAIGKYDHHLLVARRGDSRPG